MANTSELRVRVTIVDAEVVAREILARQLTHEGFCVHQLGNFRLFDEVVPPETALVLCDVDLPGEGGFNLVRRLHAQWPDVGLIVLTGRGELVDRVLGLELGADDYIQKPCELKELLARIRSVLRRRDKRPAAPLPRRPTINFAGWTVDVRHRTVTAPDGRPVDLTTTEFEILSVLGGRHCQTVHRQTLYELVKGRSWSPLDRRLDTHVANLRRKLCGRGYGRLIKTVHGQGYVLTTDE